MPRVLFVFGTRPEAIKLSPTILHLRSQPDFETRVCVTAQHREMLDQVLSAFGIVPDHDLNVMQPGQSLTGAAARALAGLETVLREDQPDLVLVQGDTVTTLCGALAGFYARIPVGHVEAGLRTGNLDHPFPEEANRLLTGRIATLHFAATEPAAANLRAEGVPEARIFVTGNTGIDAVLQVRDRLETGALAAPEWPWLEAGRTLVLVTAHRRESFGVGLARICSALAEIARRPDVQIAYPVHPNPQVRLAAQRLASVPNIHLLEPLDYVPFVDLMRRAGILLTDSGGIQEEGPSLGKPILVMRKTTERPEGVAAGCAELVGSDPERIVAAVSQLLDNPEKRFRMGAVHNPYGDGRASIRIASAIRSFFDKNQT